MSLYTGNGDTGYSSTIKKSHVPKSDLLFELLGNLDELNVALGGCKLVCMGEMKNFIEELQRDIMRISGCVAKEVLDDEAYYISRVQFFESIMNKNPLNLSSFVLPGLSGYDYRFHLARVATRRAERSMVGFSKNALDISFRILPLISYINRLSDLLFTFSVKKPIIL
ncbi:MAG TPA: ATP:cob(I)alamin adenosyltransferase [candidate division WWE3 bacterium]|uniref:Corrinoid adenosyltransferase n=1 Tax=candidate division WWE3 bacterium TaxID=2053526 RepID=A0A7C1DJ30_UNCKA|nr:ATP:cob(I)alamin adenosyltransferase [candidate division WWE3 bacterium]